MRDNTVYFGNKCTNCGEQVYGAQPELIHAMWIDGHIDQHNACSKCAVLIKAHNDAVDKELGTHDVPESAAQPVAKAAAPAAAVAPMDALAQALTMIAQGQQAILNELKEMKHPTLPAPEPEPEQPAKKANAKQPARTARRR